jgi:WD40 repeat protein
MTTIICILIAAFTLSAPARTDAGESHLGPITDITVSGADGTIYSCSQGGIFTGIGDRLQLELRPNFRVTGLAISKQNEFDTSPGLLIAGGEPGISGIVGWRPPGGQLRTFTIAKDMIDGIAMSPDSRFAAAACADGQVLVCASGNRFGAEHWSLRHRHTAAVRAVSFSPDGRWLASAGLDGVVIISSLSAELDAEPLHLNDHSSGVECLVFSPDSQSIASGSQDSRVRVHQVGGKLLRTYDALGMDGEPVAGRVPSRVLSIVWGRRALVAGISKGTLHLLSTQDDRKVDIPQDGNAPVTSLALAESQSSPPLLLVGAESLHDVDLETISLPASGGPGQKD